MDGRSVSLERYNGTEITSSRAGVEDWKTGQIMSSLSLQRVWPKKRVVRILTLEEEQRRREIEYY